MVSQRRERERPRRKHSHDHGQKRAACFIFIDLTTSQLVMCNNVQFQPDLFIKPSVNLLLVSRWTAEWVFGLSGAGTRGCWLRQLLVLHEQRAGIHVLLRFRGWRRNQQVRCLVLSLCGWRNASEKGSGRDFCRIKAVLAVASYFPGTYHHSVVNSLSFSYSCKFDFFTLHTDKLNLDHSVRNLITPYNNVYYRNMI